MKISCLSFLVILAIIGIALGQVFNVGGGPFGGGFGGGRLGGGFGGGRLGGGFGGGIFGMLIFRK